MPAIVPALARVRRTVRRPASGQLLERCVRGVAPPSRGRTRGAHVDGFDPGEDARDEVAVVERGAVAAAGDFVVGGAVDIIEHWPRQAAFRQRAKVVDIVAVGRGSLFMFPFVSSEVETLTPARNAARLDFARHEREVRVARASKHRPRRHRPLGRKAEARFDCQLRIEDMRRDALADRGAVLEPVPRSATDQPDALLPRKAVDQIVAVRAVLILADAPADQRRRGEAGKRRAI